MNTDTAVDVVIEARFTSIPGGRSVEAFRQLLSDEAADFSLDTIMEEATSFEATVTPVPLPANIVRLADIIGN
jgi:hypothetical protein